MNINNSQPNRSSDDSLARPGTGDAATQYSGGEPTYTTGTSVPGDRPWNGSMKPVVVEHMADECIKCVQHLIELNIDSVKGWETAADSVTDASLKGRFREFAGQRRRFADELSGLVRVNGAAPVDHGTTGGSLHRWWMNLRASLGVAETKAVLIEAERGEDAIKHAYENALREQNLGELRRVVEEQSVQVKRVHDETKMLRDSWNAR